MNAYSPVFHSTLRNYSKYFKQMLLNEMSVKTFVEQVSIPIFYWWSYALGFRSTRIRLLFIYITFIAIKSPFLALSLTFNFLTDLRNYFNKSMEREL